MNAPPATVLKAVTTFDRYAGRLAQCSYSTVYGRSQNRMKGTENIKVHMKLAGGVKTFNCYYDHTVTPKKERLRGNWTRTRRRTSSTSRASGTWQNTPQSRAGRASGTGGGRAAPLAAGAHRRPALQDVGHEGPLLRQEGGRGACFLVVGARARGLPAAVVSAAAVQAVLVSGVYYAFLDFLLRFFSS